MKQKSVLYYFGILLLAACSKNESNHMDKKQIAIEIRAIEKAYNAAIRQKDIETALNFYADNAESYSPDKPPLIGKRAIGQYLEEGLGQPEDYITEYQMREILPSADGNQVVELGTFRVTTPQGEKITEGNYISIFQKQNGRYVCVRDMAARTAPGTQGTP